MTHPPPGKYLSIAANQRVKREDEKAARADPLPSDEAARVIAAFPATGKSHVAQTAPGFADSDSSRFSWRGTRERHPDWPGNYIAHLRELLRSDLRVLVSTHAEVRDALVAADIPFTLVYPSIELREEYRARMQQRGSPPGLIAKVIDELWPTAIRGCEQQEGCEHVVLGAGTYLSDVLAIDMPRREAEPLPRTDDRGYDLRQRFNRAVRWLRDAEDIARIEMPAMPTADRIRDIYEQITDDLLNGKTTVPPLKQRLREAEEREAEVRAATLREVEPLRERLATMNECVRIYLGMRDRGTPARPGWLEEEVAASDTLLAAHFNQETE